MALRDFIKKHQPEYPIVIESKRTKDRTNTQASVNVRHFGCVDLPPDLGTERKCSDFLFLKLL